MESAVPVDKRVKIKESEKLDKYVELARELKQIVEYEGQDNTNRRCCAWDGPLEPSEGTEETRNK